MSLPTRGRVILETTAGDIDIELWSKEAPKACRNFIALSLEGYYDGVIFHRIVPGFLVQTGDRTGTGGGGESFFGEPFEDEIHPRLRFAHRGLVAMANNGTKNSNDSQFIITLGRLYSKLQMYKTISQFLYADRADELHGKHTLFGRCVGDTVYNVMKIGEMEIDKTERPLYPPKIKRVRVVDNPFDDIVPRITAEEKRAQQKAREQAQREREEEIKRKGAKKNVNLLSFADDPEEADSEPTIKKKAIVRPDLAEPGPTARVPNFVVELSAPQTDKNGKQGGVDSPEEPKSSKKAKEKEEDITKIREQHAREHASEADARKAEIAKVEEEIRKLNKKRGGDDSDDEPTKKRPKVSYLEQEMAKYKKLQRPGNGKKRRDEGDVLAALDSFRGKLQSRLHDDLDAMDVHVDAAGGAEAKDAPLATEDPGVEVDDDLGFLGHKLHFPKDDGEETRKAEHDYEVIDPRGRDATREVIDPRQRGAQAKEEERKRKERSMKGNGGRGRRYR